MQGYVTRDEFTELLTDTLDAQASEAQSLFDKVDSTNSGKLTYGKSLMPTGRVIIINLKKEGRQFRYLCLTFHQSRLPVALI